MEVVTTLSIDVDRFSPSKILRTNPHSLDFAPVQDMSTSQSSLLVRPDMQSCDNCHLHMYVCESHVMIKH